MTLHVVLTVVEPGPMARAADVAVRAGEHRLVSELADDLAVWLGLARGQTPYGVRVRRTGEHLVPHRRLDEVDLREGDTLELLAPGETAATREARRPLRRLSQPDPRPQAVPSEAPNAAVPEQTAPW